MLAITAAIKPLLLRLPAGGAVVGGTPLVRTLLVMCLSATERTTQVDAPRAARMGQEVDPTACAGHEALPQLGMGLQDRVQSGLILTNKWISAIVLVPVIANRENFPDCYNKKPRRAVTMSSSLITPSSYRLDAQASRGRARFFCALPRNRRSCSGTTATTRTP